jgi:hypothetical protein
MLLMWDVNYRTLDIRRNEESLRNDVDILDSILNVCVFKVMVVVWIAKWQNYRWQMKYEKCDLGRELAYI